MPERNFLRQLKDVKAERGERKDLAELRKEQNAHERAILAAIAAEPKTVPEIAEETGLDPLRVFWMINALRKYNKAETIAKSGDYMTYIKK
jgi:predicted Rossmann fold nucleotide-binding protein DprA/Smf involved in DNA uptake